MGVPAFSDFFREATLSAADIGMVVSLAGFDEEGVVALRRGLRGVVAGGGWGWGFVGLLAVGVGMGGWFWVCMPKYAGFVVEGS